VDLYLYSFFDRDLTPCHFSPGKVKRYVLSLYRVLRGPHGGLGEVQKISLPQGLDPRSVRPVSSHYIEYAILHNSPPPPRTVRSKISKFNRKSEIVLEIKDREERTDGQCALCTWNPQCAWDDHVMLWSGTQFVRIRASCDQRNRKLVLHSHGWWLHQFPSIDVLHMRMTLLNVRQTSHHWLMSDCDKLSGFSTQKKKYVFVRNRGGCWPFRYQTISQQMI
jgi:hypothetical protein